ncbi:MAG: hypothetical protein UHO11_09770 [Treponema sp.]|nr:hypothetical protein [Treponema sp.]
MDYSYIFRSAKIKKESLEAAGFKTTDGKTSRGIHEKNAVN